MTSAETESTPDFTHYTDMHGAETEGTGSDIALLGGDYGDLRATENVYELTEMADSVIESASENYSEVKALPGNHEVESAPSIDEIYDKALNEDGEFDDGSESLYEHLTGKEGEDPEDAENIFDLIVAQYDNVEDVSYSSFEIGDHTVVAGGTHQDPEIPKEVYDLLESDPEKEELGYDEETLEEIADDLTEEDGFNYRGLDRIPVLGRAIEYVGDKIFDYFFSDPLDIDEISLEDVPEELRTENHESYVEQLAEIEENYSEQIEAMNEKKEKLQGLIDEAEGPVIAFDHGLPMADDAGLDLDYVERVDAHKGSVVWKELLQENDVDTFIGGHFHGEMEDEVYGTELRNPGEHGYQEVTLGDDIEFEASKLEAHGKDVESSENAESSDINEFVEQQVQQISDDAIPDEALEEFMEDTEISDREEALEQFKRGYVIRNMQSQASQEAPA